jgi:hypothetical protein
MSFSVNGISRLDTSINSIQAQTQTQSQEQNTVSNSTGDSWGSDSVSIGQNDTISQTYNSSGQMDKAEFDARLISSTLDKMNSNPFGSSAESGSYQFNKDVLSAYLK